MVVRLGKSLLFLACVWLQACARPPTLDAPCPDYGRFCIQTPINDPEGEKDEL